MKYPEYILDLSLEIGQVLECSDQSRPDHVRENEIGRC